MAHPTGLHHALTLLTAGHTVTSTAAACGWANPTNFIEAFSAALGETPARYRHNPGTTTSPTSRAGMPAAAVTRAKAHNEPLSLDNGHDIDVLNGQPDAVASPLLRWTASPATP